jgi:hypothetical protein
MASPTVVIYQEVPEPMIGVVECTTCGSVVIDSQAHDRWHNRIDNIGRTAREADQWASLHSLNYSTMHGRK